MKSRIKNNHSFNNSLTRLNTEHSVDTDKQINFTFDGKRYLGYEGDTLASALLANGVKRVGRSFKLHRPRGLLGAGCEEPNALVQLENGGLSEPNARATLVPLYQGLKARGQNAWPSVDWDVLGLMGWFHRLLPASFYYKSMIWPNWHFYERFVRPLAGLGKVPEANDAQQYHKRNVHCDVLIVGAGPAGLAAALAAGRSGVRVMLMDEQECLGGSLLSQNTTIGNASSQQWLVEALAELTALPKVTLLPRTTVAGYYEQNFLVAVERVTNHLGGQANNKQPRERLWRVRAKQVVIATGAIERPLVFENNDRPGVMLASAVQIYANRYGVAAGERVVVLTNNDSAYQTALDLHRAGVTVAAVVDSRAHVAGPYQQAVREKNIPLMLGCLAQQVKGRRQVAGVTLSEHKGGGVLGNTVATIDCDVIAMSGGWTPTIHLYSQAGGTLAFDDSSHSFVPDKCAQAVTVAGSANGAFSLKACLEQGFQQGRHAAQAEAINTMAPNTAAHKEDSASVGEQAVASAEWPQEAMQPYWYIRNANTEKQWLDFQYDVKVSDIELAQRENFVSIEHVKRYTTNGMSIDQGKTSNMNTLAVMAELSGRKIPEVGTTKFRPPYHPVTLGTFVGRDLGDQYAPRLEMPAHRWHISHGAHMADMGGWQRPECYVRAGETMDDAIKREVNAARNAVGLFDGSPLGKIEVKGPDAAAFLNKIYINNAATLQQHRARYGLMCNENGVVIDDGVFVRLAEDHFLVHTTSGGATTISQWMEEWLQCEWLDLRVIINNVTTQWATATISGPNARKVLQTLNSDIDFERDAFPHMHYREGLIQGVRARVLRASFTGEISYEVSVPASCGLSLWEVLFEAGQDYGITPYGVESLMVLRCEKGYLHVGADTDGTTNPLDLGWGFPISKKQDDFIGRRSLSRPNDVRENRLQFVGLEAVDSHTSLPIGGHVVASANPTIPEQTQGYVTSACLSPTLNKSIGLGIVAGGQARTGEHVFVFANGQTVAATIVSPTHFDAKGDRLSD